MSANKRVHSPDNASLKKPKMVVADVEIDENLHSRQLAVYGREVMKRMAASNVLISGLNGLGVEIAKNVILAGLKSVTVHDKATVTKRDLGAQFYLTEADIGKNRAAACKDNLQELNTAVNVAASSADLDDAFLKQFQVVVLADSTMAEAQRIDEFCHAQKPAISFIRAQTAGVFASVFADFGPDFTVIDTDGEEPHSGIVASIETGPNPMVTCVEDERLEFQDGELVTFSEVNGMTKINGGNPIKVKNCKAHSFQLELDTSSYGEYARGGIVTQVKEHKKLAFKTLAQAVTAPGEFLMTDFAKFDRPPLLHVGFQAIEAFKAETSRAPKPANAADAEKLISLAKAVNEKMPAEAKAEINEDVLKKLAHNASSEINPICALFGGFVGQEVVKAVSGKFHPLFQWLYFDSIESLPSEVLPAAEYEPMGSRYDGQIAVFGRTLQKKMADTNLFLVGAGALGCEFLKNFAMMGIADGGDGLITVTDDDVIEKSNLSRQFLFRDWNIGSSKSKCAADATNKVNPAVKINPLENRVSPDTETHFNDAFWGKLNVVVNALDNVNARLYVDSRCVYFCKPLLESGTLGPKCNTQVVIPHLTENYGASRDPPEKQAPMCTLHSFPHNIDHCLTWARSEFQGLLEKAPGEANSFLSDCDKYLDAIKANKDAAAKQQLEQVIDVLANEKCSTFEDCIRWARLRFQEYFYNRIAQLTFTFPEDSTTSTGTPFWSAPKRFPRPLTFSAKDPAHASFVQAGAILKAEVYGIARPDWAAGAMKVAEASLKVDVPAFEPRKGVQIETDPKAAKNSSSLTEDDEAVIDNLMANLLAAKAKLPAGFKLAPIQFEKDDDTNFHMDFIAGLANMRARNYEISEVDKLKAKLIAGRIIPAIATATAAATGLVCLELYKVLQDKKVEDYRNTFANLALPLFAMAEPVPPKPTTHNNMTWTLWDRWILEGDLTVQQVLDYFTERKLNAYSISCGQSLIWSSMFPKHKDRLTQKMSALVTTVAKMEIPANKKHFDVVVACEDDDGEDLDAPLVSIKFR